MNDQFVALYRRMCNPITFEQLQAIYQQLKAIGVNHDLLVTSQDVYEVEFALSAV